MNVSLCLFTDIATRPNILVSYLKYILLSVCVYEEIRRHVYIDVLTSDFTVVALVSYRGSKSHENVKYDRRVF